MMKKITQWVIKVISYGYGELNTNKISIFQNLHTVENQFRVDVQTSPSTRFKFDNRLPVQI